MSTLHPVADHPAAVSYPEASRLKQKKAHPHCESDLSSMRIIQKPPSSPPAPVWVAACPTWQSLEYCRERILAVFVCWVCASVATQDPVPAAHCVARATSTAKCSYCGCRV